MNSLFFSRSDESSVRSSLEQNGKRENIEPTLPTAAARFTDCPFCSFTSIDSEAFRKHVLNNHLSDKNFRCLVCNRLYRYRGDCMFSSKLYKNYFFRYNFRFISYSKKTFRSNDWR